MVPPLFAAWRPISQQGSLNREGTGDAAGVFGKEGDELMYNK